MCLLYLYLLSLLLFVLYLLYLYFHVFTIFVFIIILIPGKFYINNVSWLFSPDSNWHQIPSSLQDSPQYFGQS